MKRLDCSVVIATRGAAGGLGRTLQGLSSQTFDRADYELVVVDNNDSPDASALLDRTLAPFDVVVVREPVPGAGAARNAGVEAASGDVVVFVDDDMEVDESFLESHLAAHREHGANVAVGTIVEYNEHSSWFRRYLVDRHVVNRVPDPNSVDFRNVYGANSSVDRELFRRVGGFDAGFLRREDAELGFRLQAAGATFTLAEGAVGRHHSSFGPLDHFKRSYANGYYLAMLVAKHPAAGNGEKLENYGWRRALMAGAAALPLLLAGLIAYPVTRRPFNKGMTALVLVQNARGFQAFQRTARQP